MFEYKTKIHGQAVTILYSVTDDYADWENAIFLRDGFDATDDFVESLSQRELNDIEDKLNLDLADRLADWAEARAEDAMYERLGF